MKNKTEETIKEIYQQEIQAPPRFGRFNELRVIFFCLIISFLSGFLAALLKDNLIGQPASVGTTINVKSGNKAEILDLNFLLSKEDQSYNKVLNQLRSQTVGFYKKRAVTEDILNSLYLEKDFLGSGIVITSDGWLLTHQQVIDKQEVVIITADKKVYELLKKVTDPFSNTVLVQISAKDLAPVKFADLDYSQVTDPLLTVRYSTQNHGSDIVKTSIQRFSYHDQVKPSDFILSTERIDHYLKIANDFDLIYNGAALFNDKSEVVGLMFVSGRDKIRLAVPGYYLNSAVSNFLASSSEVMRANLGVNYLDLSESLGLSAKVTEGRVKGAVLLGSKELNLLAVKPGSPAETAGLKAGDIVLKVNDEEINDKNSLTRLVQDYTPGQELKLNIIRAGKEMEIKAVVGEM